MLLFQVSNKLAQFEKNVDVNVMVSKSCQNCRLLHTQDLEQKLVKVPTGGRSASSDISSAIEVKEKKRWDNGKI